MESRFVNATIFTLFAGVVTVQLLRLFNAWIRSAEAYSDHLNKQHIVDWVAFAESLSEEDDDELPPEFN